eukprot:8595522-Pyramimonas_sp.AAC.1
MDFSDFHEADPLRKVAWVEPRAPGSPALGAMMFLAQQRALRAARVLYFRAIAEHGNSSPRCQHRGRNWVRG